MTRLPPKAFRIPFWLMRLLLWSLTIATSCRGINAWSWPSMTTTNTRRKCLQTLPTVMTSGLVLLLPADETFALADTDEGRLPPQQQQKQQQRFVSAASPKTEYTNSIVASRDTNISPLEVYDTIRSRLTLQQEQEQSQSSNKNKNSPRRPLRALDVGAGAGVSTQVIYDELGIQTIDAVDWSGDAWQLNVVEGGYCPSSVNFYAMDDERFVEQVWKPNHLPRYDIIAFNFAVNREKAMYFCQELLQPDGGLLLAPINTQKDYWLKQTYQLLDAQGRVTWSANDVGAWSVQFQPDVTSETCQGIWCAPFNGFQKLRRY